MDFGLIADTNRQETQLSLTNRVTRLETLTFEKCRNLQTGVRVTEGHLEMSPFDTVHATSY